MMTIGREVWVLVELRFLGVLYPWQRYDFYFVICFFAKKVHVKLSFNSSVLWIPNKYQTISSIWVHFPTKNNLWLKRVQQIRIVFLTK